MPGRWMLPRVGIRCGRPLAGSARQAVGLLVAPLGDREAREERVLAGRLSSISAAGKDAASARRRDGAPVRIEACWVVTRVVYWC